MRGARLTGAAAMLALTFAGGARAATISVTTTGDPGTAGTTSLRQAIAAAADGDTVSVPPGHYTLAMGQTPVTHAIAIVGAGSASTVVDANHASRVFDVTSTGTVAINGVTIENGSADVGSNLGDGGAGIRDLSGTGTLMLTSDTLTGNALSTAAGAQQQGGGAVFVKANGLTITSSTLDGNEANLQGAPGDDGGGAVFEDKTALTISSSSFTSNTATVTGSSGSCCVGGGAIVVDQGSADISGSAVTGNSVSASDALSNTGGGGIFSVGAALTVHGSNVSGNSATISGSGTVNGGGGIFTAGGSSSFSMSSSTVASNTATLTGTSSSNGGGGILDNGSSPALVNVTLTDNALSMPSNGSSGGGGYWGNSPATFTNATVTGNQSSQPGGGIFKDGSGLTLMSTIVAGNSASSGNANCGGSVPTSAGYNLEDTSPTTCGLTHAGDLVGMAAGLGPLQDNGGPAPTHALQAGSPAIDHIPAAQCTDQQTTPQPVSTDERGVPRSLDGSCDVGAYEFAPADLGVTATASPASIVVNQGSTATLTVANSGPAPSTGTNLNVKVPSGLGLVSVTPSQGTCTGATCSLGLLAAGGTAHVTLLVTGTHPGSQSLGASVSANEPDPTAADNTTSATITVSPPILSQFKVKPKSFKRHSRVSYTLNAAASVRFVVERCTRSSHKHHRLKCKKLFSFILNASAGANSFELKRRLHGHKLKPGSYKLVARPAIAGTKGNSVSAPFRLG